MKDRIYIYLFLFFLVSCSKEKKTYNRESENAQLDFYLNQLNQQSKSQKEKLYINNQVFQQLKNRENSNYTRRNLLKVIEIYDQFDELNSLQVSNRMLLKKSQASNDTMLVGYSYYYFGQNSYKRNVYDSAYLYYSKAEKILVGHENNSILGNLFLNKSSIQLNYNDYLGAENSATKALKYSRLEQNLLCQYDAYTNLGIASIGNENYEKSIEYHTKALQLAEENKLHPEYFLKEISLNNIGNCYQNLKQYPKAIKSFEKALLNKKLKYYKPVVYSTLLDNLAYCKFKNGEVSNLEKLFLESLRINDSLGLDSKIIYSKVHLSEFIYTKDTIRSQRFAKEALNIAKKTKNSNDLLISLKQISLVDHKEAAQYSKEYIKISDSLQIEERKAKDKFARIAFETDEIIQEKDKLAEQNRSLLYFFVGTLFVGLLLFVIRTQRAKNRELMLKQQQQKANEEIYNLMISQQATIEENRVREKKRIAQELHDGVLGRLFGARLNLDSLNRSTDEESINNRFNYLNELKNIEQDIREISHDLNREKHALINNFVAIVNNLLEEQSNSFEPELTSSMDEKIQWDAIGNTTKINLYRILQESLQNINKYAQAKHIHVEFKTDENTLTLKVTDDGVGFEVDTKKRGIGLQNMLSRTSESEGTFEVQSKKGKGTTITVSVPLVQKQVEA